MTPGISIEEIEEEDLRRAKRISMDFAIADMGDVSGGAASTTPFDHVVDPPAVDPIPDVLVPIGDADSTFFDSSVEAGEGGGGEEGEGGEGGEEEAADSEPPCPMDVDEEEAATCEAERARKRMRYFFKQPPRDEQ